MKSNVARKTPIRTHQGAPAFTHNPLTELRRAVLSCMLFEDTFYEDGVSVAERISELVTRVDPADAMALAEEARTKYHLRHVPLWVLAGMARAGTLKADAVVGVVQRPDEMGELLALYWGKTVNTPKAEPLPAQLKKGLARAFTKFDAYQLAKWDKPNAAIRLRDVMFLVHPKPRDAMQSVTFKHLADGTLASADTWEKRLSGGESKAKAFGDLLRENRLGYMALLRNLRNMEGEVPEDLVRTRLIEGAAKSKALPFRFLAAARHAPRFEDTLDHAMQASMAAMERLEGHTAILVDVSGSMHYSTVSGKSQMTRMDAAAALAILLAGVSERATTFSFSHDVVEVPPRRGAALADAIIGSQAHGGTWLGEAVKGVVGLQPKRGFDRLVVITDEQSHDAVGGPGSMKGYMLNVAPYQPSVGYGDWTRISGFSEASVDFIREFEKFDRS